MTYSPAVGRGTPEGLGKRKGVSGGAGSMARDASQPYLKKQQACLTCKRRKVSEWPGGAALKSRKAVITIHCSRTAYALRPHDFLRHI